MEKILDNQQRKPIFSSPNSKYLVGAMLILAVLTGIIPTMLQAIGILGLAVLSVFTGEIYLLYPIMLFYGNHFGLVAGISVMRLYTLLFFVITLMGSSSVKIRAKQLLVFVIFVVYCVVVIMPDNFRRAIFAVLDMVCIILLIERYLRKPACLTRFFYVYVMCAFAAYLTGTRLEGLQAKEYVGLAWVSMVRNMATFEDPNYMGYFYTGAIFATLSLKLFSPKWRIIIIVALYAILLTSLSLSTIILNVVLWMIYLAVTKLVNFKTLAIILVICALVLMGYAYAVDHPDTWVIGSLAVRISTRLEQLALGNYGDATSARSSLPVRHLEYFVDQPVYKMLIGMNAASTIKMDLDGITAAAHSEYVDWLLNVGLIGTAVMLYYVVSGTWKLLQKYRKNMYDRHTLCMLMVKLVWICYAFTLTLYGDYRFMLFFLL